MQFLEVHDQFADRCFGLVRPGTENELKRTPCERPEMGMCLEILSHEHFLSLCIFHFGAASKCLRAEEGVL